MKSGHCLVLVCKRLLALHPFWTDEALIGRLELKAGNVDPSMSYITAVLNYSSRGLKQVVRDPPSQAHQAFNTNPYTAQLPSNLPVVVLVPGAWTVPAAYRKLVSSLEAKSFNVHVPALPTNNGARPPDSSHNADVALVRQVVETLVNDGIEVFMLMHSYGGAVGTNAIEGLTHKDQQAKGLSGGVVQLLFLSAYLLAKGGSIMKTVEKEGNVDGLVEFAEDGTGIPTDPIKDLYHDLSAEDQEEQMHLVTRNNMAMAFGENVYEAWRDVPSTYVYTTLDRCVPPVYQDSFLATVKEAGCHIDVVVFECAHSAYAKCPDDVTALVVKITGSS